MISKDFIVWDPLYGPITIPQWLCPVVFSPELQRLRGIRLLNTASPSCSALSETRRFTHTMGVLFLARRLAGKITRNFSLQDSRTFLVSALLHDIGTPAFGHLFEYQLAAMKGWNHERFVSDIIRGTYRPEKRYQQIYYGNAIRLHQILKDVGVDPEEVVRLVNGQGPLGPLLAGFVDLDNIDNVFRMATLLGFHPDIMAPSELVDAIIPTKQGPIFDKEAFPILELWRDLRRQVYEVLVFDEQCLSGQAMLTDCFSTALKSEYLKEEHWPFTDEDMLKYLFANDATREAIKRFAVGDFYTPVFIGWYSCPKKNIDLRHHDQRAKLAQELHQVTKLTCSPYVFYDSGTFSKRLTLNFRTGDIQERAIDLGEKSESTVIGIFTSMRIGDAEMRRVRNPVLELLGSYELDPACLKPLPVKEDRYEVSGQRRIPF
jgi:HD superfamily phosphohydrolase